MNLPFLLHMLKWYESLAYFVTLLSVLLTFSVKMQVQTVCSTSAETSRIFKKQILDKCQHEFQRSDSEEDKVTELMEKLKVTEAEEKEKVQAEIEDLKSTMRKRALGNVRFIGELYKLHMLTPKIMVSCVRLLLSKFKICLIFFSSKILEMVLLLSIANPDDEKLESLCKLLSTVGKKLDDQLKDLEVKAKKEGKPGPEEKLMEKFFAQLDKLSGDKKICSRIRFAIMVCSYTYIHITSYCLNVLQRAIEFAGSCRIKAESVDTSAAGDRPQDY